jgi:uncharacterized MAPEG superfamily protein
MNLVYPTVAHWCVLIVCFLPIVCAGIAKWGMFGVRRSEGGYDNHQPREWLAKQGDWRARANGAQANSFEALPFFVAAVLIAHQLHAPQARIDVLALLFVFLRLIYIIMYVADAAKMRTVVWILAFAVNVGIFFTAY